MPARKSLAWCHCYEQYTHKGYILSFVGGIPTDVSVKSGPWGNNLSISLLWVGANLDKKKIPLTWLRFEPRSPVP